MNKIIFLLTMVMSTLLFSNEDTNLTVIDKISNYEKNITLKNIMPLNFHTTFPPTIFKK